MSAGHVASMLELEIPENPFPGLRPFEFNESLLYFGRDGQSEQLLRRLSATRFLAVVGTSGSGKSSVVRAGLLPALLGGFMTSAGSNWKIALMRPGFDPIGNLARALAAPEVLGSDGDHEVLAAMAESTLRRGNFGLMDLAQQARIGSGQNLLIVADQFEELFRVAGFAESEAYRNHAAAFVKLLLEASRQRELPIYVVLTMRSDFLGDCASFWGLPEAINEGQYLIPRLTREQRREAITGPIAVCGGAITERLVTRLLNDMGDDQDQLPLLQHALMRTWGKWKEEGAGRPAIDLEHYESIGGMSDALSLHVDEAFNSLPDARTRLIAEKAFKGLTEKGPDNREIRRPVTLAGLSLVTGASESELTQVIDTFREQGRSFLMPPAELPLTSAAMIDISHESLIRNWRRLKAWVDEEARSARIYRRLAETAALHREGNASLWRDPDLQVALTWREQSRPNKEWAERYHHEFEEAIGFLDASLAEQGAEQSAREAERRDREIRRSKQIRNARMTTVALALGFMVCLGTLLYAMRQKQEAISQKQEVIRQSEQVSAALDEANLQKQEAVLQSGRATEAVKIAKAETAKFEEAEKKAKASANLAEKNRLVAVAQKANADQQKEKALHLVYATDFKLAQRTHSRDIARADELLTATNSKGFRGFEWYHIWNRYHTAEHTIKGYERSLTSVAFSPTQKNLLATGSADGTLALVDSVSGKSDLLTTNASSIWESIFSPDGNKLAVLRDVLGDSNTVDLWDVRSRQRRATLPRQPGDPQIECIAFWQQGKLAAGNEQGSITVWDLETPHKRETLKYPGPPKSAMPDVVALASSPRTDILVSAYEDGLLRIWKPGSPKPEEQLFKHGQVTALAISPDGKLLAATTKEGWLAVWVTGDIFRQEEFKELEKQGEPLFEKKLLPKGFNGLAFSEDGKVLATAGVDGVVAFWNMQTLRDARSELDRLELEKQSTRGESELKEINAQMQTLKREARRAIAPEGDSLPVEHGGPITCIAFSGDGHTFASGSSDRTVKVWRLRSDRNKEKGVISPDGQLVAIVGPDTIKVLKAGQVQSTLPIDPNLTISSLVFSADSKALVASLENGTVKVYDPKAGEKIALSTGTPDISSDARFVAERDGEVVRVWNSARGEVSHTFLPRQGSNVQSQGFSPDSKTIAVSYSDGTAKVYYLETAEEFEIAKMGRGDQSVLFSPDSKLLDLKSGGDPRARSRIEDQVTNKTWNVEKRRLASRAELAGKSKLREPESALTVRSPTGGKIASAQDETITMSAVKTKQPITKTKAHVVQVTSLAFSPDGKTLASGGLDGTVKLWDANTMEYLSDIPSLKKTNGTLNPIVSLAFSSDGKRLAMGTNTGTGLLVVWDLLARQELLRLPETLPTLSTFSSDDKALGSHTLERIWLGALDTDRVTSLSREAAGPGDPFTWMSSRDEVAIPGNALIAGYSSSENVFLNVCRLRYKDNVYFGYTWGGDCHVSDIGSLIGQFNFGSYEILLNADSISWRTNIQENVATRPSTPPWTSAGERADGKQVAICRATDPSGTYIGWTVDNKCHIGNGLRPLQFEILHKGGVERTTTASSIRRSR